MLGHADEEAEIEVVRQQTLDEGIVLVALLATNRQAGALRTQPSDHLGQHVHRHALERPDDEATDLSGPQRTEAVLGLAQPVEHRRGVHQQQFTRGGELDLAGPARPVEHPVADGPFEGGDLLADRRLGEAQPLGRPPERTLGSDRLEGTQLADLDVLKHGVHHKQS